MKLSRPLIAIGIASALLVGCRASLPDAPPRSSEETELCERLDTQTRSLRRAEDTAWTLLVRQLRLDEASTPDEVVAPLRALSESMRRRGIGLEIEMSTPFTLNMTRRSGTTIEGAERRIILAVLPQLSPVNDYLDAIERTRVPFIARATSKQCAIDSSQDSIDRVRGDRALRILTIATALRTPAL